MSSEVRQSVTAWLHLLETLPHCANVECYFSNFEIIHSLFRHTNVWLKMSGSVWHHSHVIGCESTIFYQLRKVLLLWLVFCCVTFELSTSPPPAAAGASTPRSCGWSVWRGCRSRRCRTAGPHISRRPSAGSPEVSGALLASVCHWWNPRRS